MKTLIISPTYNEVKNIQSLVEQIFELDPSYHLLIIDDNSPDGTADKVKELKSLFDNLHLEERPKKAGLGTAYKFGFNWALKNGYDAVVQMDADLSHDPNDVPRLISQLKHHDLKLVRDRVQVLHVLVLLRAVDDLIRGLFVDALLHDLLPVLLLRVRDLADHRRVLGDELVQ